MATFDTSAFSDQHFAGASFDFGEAAVEAVAEVTSGATWKHLWNPVREVSVESVRVEATSRVNTLAPVAERTPRVSAEPPFVSTTARSRVVTEAPTTGAMPPMVRVRASERVRYKKPKPHVNTNYVRVIGHSRVNKLPPTPAVVVMPVPVRGKSHYAYWTPETVQNPTDEMMYFL